MWGGGERGLDLSNKKKGVHLEENIQGGHLLEDIQGGHLLEGVDTYPTIPNTSLCNFEV